MRERHEGGLVIQICVYLSGCLKQCTLDPGKRSALIIEVSCFINFHFLKIFLH